MDFDLYTNELDFSESNSQNLETMDYLAQDGDEGYDNEY